MRPSARWSSASKAATGGTPRSEGGSPKAVRATIRADVLTQTREAAVRLEGRKLKVTGGRLTDLFPPYVRHVYEVH